MNNYSLGKKIKENREKANLSQEQLAEQLNISRNFLSALERNIKTPSLETFIKICNALNVSSDVLLCGVLNTGYKVIISQLSSKLEGLPKKDQERIFNVIGVLITDN